jgi:hypothetical protein
LKDKNKVDAQLEHTEKTLWNMDLNTNSKRQDYKIGTVCGGVLVGGRGWKKETKVRIYG